MKHTKVKKKSSIGLVLIVVFAILILTVPKVIGIDISPILTVSSLILISVYIVISFEMIHRSAIALLGAIIIITAAISFGTIHAEESLEL